jgi:mono/diheme cytochrome c family protein
MSKVIGPALTFAIAASTAALFVVPGQGSEVPHSEQSVHARSDADQTRIRVAQAEAGAVDKPVSYSDDQADRGKKKFDGDCVDCHGDDLRGGLNGGPPLRGNAFEETYANGAPASALFGFMSTAMPPNDPGRYSASVYADLMAYVLKVNGFQSGAPLPSDLDALDHLTMEK